MDLKSLFRYFITKEKLVFSLYLWDFTSYFPQHCLYFLPLPHGVWATIFLYYFVKILPKLQIFCNIFNKNSKKSSFLYLKRYLKFDYFFNSFFCSFDDDLSKLNNSEYKYIFLKRLESFLHLSSILCFIPSDNISFGIFTI